MILSSYSASRLHDLSVEGHSRNSSADKEDPYEGNLHGCVATLAHLVGEESEYLFDCVFADLLVLRRLNGNLGIIDFHFRNYP